MMERRAEGSHGSSVLSVVETREPAPWRLAPHAQGTGAPESRLWGSRGHRAGVSCGLPPSHPASGLLVKACVLQSRVQWVRLP